MRCVRYRKRKGKESGKANFDSGYILCKCDGYEVTGYKINGLDKKDYILQTENNGFILKSKGDYALPYGQTIEITYTVKSGVLTNGKVIDNTASAWAAGIPETRASRQVYINSPKIM